MTPDDDVHEWVSLEGDDASTWLFDTAFLLSNYHCIYGQGCPSIATDPDPDEELGCCVHGAHFVDRDDRRRVERLARELDASEWQFLSRARSRGGPIKKKKSGEWVTRKADGACIFLNRSDFEAGPGCALHLAALNRGERPLDWKPAVCWQVPIRLDVHTDEYGHETIMVRAWRRRDWGPGGDEFHWWCTEEDEAHTASTPVYLNARDELTELVGPDLYQRLAAELDNRVGATPVAISRPAR